MPRYVDHARRRSELAAAVRRVVLREGVSAASVRAVAREAGTTTGSVRYFFSTQQGLMEFAMRELADTVQRRIDAGASRRTVAARRGDALGASVDLLSEVLPLDAQRLTEARVWAAFTSQALTDRTMAAIVADANTGVQQLCRDCLTGIATLGHVSPDRDLDLETERLHSRLDGLTTHLLLTGDDGDDGDASRTRAILHTHLADLATASAPRPVEPPVRCAHSPGS